MANKQVNIRFTMPQDEFEYYKKKAYEMGADSGTALIKMKALEEARNNVATEEIETRPMTAYEQLQHDLKIEN